MVEDANGGTCIEMGEGRLVDCPMARLRCQSCVSELWRGRWVETGKVEWTKKADDVAMSRGIVVIEVELSAVNRSLRRAIVDNECCTVDRVEVEFEVECKVSYCKVAACAET